MIHDGNFVGRGNAQADHAHAHPFDGGGRDEVQEDFYAAHEVEIAKHDFGGLLGGQAVIKFKCADACLHAVGGHDFFGDVGVEIGGWIGQIFSLI